MFDIIFQNDYHKSFSVIKTNIRSLTEARNLRAQSGDIVVHTGTNKPVSNYEWLWDWELAIKEKSYAYRIVTKAIKNRSIRLSWNTVDLLDLLGDSEATDCISTELDFCDIPGTPLVYSQNTHLFCRI